MTKTVYLEVNDSGAWRRVMTFDADDGDNVLPQTEQLLRWSTNDKLRARVIMPGDTAPPETCGKERGWRKWSVR